MLRSLDFGDVCFSVGVAIRNQLYRRRQGRSHTVKSVSPSPERATETGVAVVN